MEFEKLVHGYISECRTRGVGEQTILVRELFLLRWGVWLRSSSVRMRIEDVTGEAIIKFLKRESVFKSKATVSRTMSHLRCFGDFLNREGTWKRNHVKWMRGPRMVIGPHCTKALKPNEIERMLEESFKWRDRHLQYLWPAMLICFYSLGLRRGEALRLNFSDWDAKEKTLRVLSTKSGRERFLPAPESLFRAMDAYILARHRVLAVRNRLDESALFVNRIGERLTANSCSLGAKRIAVRAGVESFHIHRLRHTCASQLVANGVTLPIVKMVLGHAVIDTTSRYVQVSGPDRRKAIELHPINQILGA
jgi:site-specific recombinase XerD